MRANLKARILYFAVTIFIFISNGYGRIWLEVQSINKENRITAYPRKLYLQAYEMYGIRIVGHFGNESATEKYTAWLRITPKTNKMPSFIAGWEEQIYVLQPGEQIDLKNNIFIHPTYATVDSFQVEAALLHGQGPYSYLVTRTFKLTIYVEPTSYDIPILLEESQFTPGLLNHIFWIPAQGSSEQDVYCFDLEDRENLIQSVKGMYKVSSSDTSAGIFENLKNAHTYGYFAKSIYESENETVSLYSTIQYSRQDNEPPESVLGTQALIDGNGDAVILWQGVEDAISAVDYYKIYRAIDTGNEQLIGLYSVTGNEPATITWTDEIDSGYTYYYRVRAMDLVGNEGNGERTNGISLDESGTTDLPPGEESEGDSTSSNSGIYFVNSVIDTLWQELNGWENAIRFQIARDSIRYFESPPSIRLRYFDSGWVVPNVLKEWGWVSSTNQDSVFFIFNYTDTSHVYFDAQGIVHHDTGNVFIDSNFVNSHTYIRRNIRRFYSTMDTTWLGNKIPDCYPPDDIRNLKLQAIIDDPDFQNPISGYQKWHFQLNWDPAQDGVSGLKGYSVYRKINGVDVDYIPMSLPENFVSTHLRDSVLLEQASIRNPFVQYRVTATDWVGNKRPLEETDWEVEERALNAPEITFTQDAGIITFPSDPSHADTVFTESNQIMINILYIDHSDVMEYLVAVNNEEHLLPYHGQNKLAVPLSSEEVSVIKLRVLYQGKRSSVWSNSKVIVRALKKVPEQFIAYNDSLKWYGHIYLRWQRPSIDVKSYDIWRSSVDEDWKLIGTTTTSAENIQWVDLFEKNEITGTYDDTLVTYKKYYYKVSMTNIFNSKSAFSVVDSSYCNYPPSIIRDEKETVGSSMVLTIFWNRVQKALPSISWKTRMRIYRDSIDTTPLHTDNVVDQTEYTFGPIEPGHNYIFQVLEMPNNLNGGLNEENRMSSWSRPYTVSLDTMSLVSVAQPRGHIYIDWNDPVRIETYKVDTFKLCRDSLCWLFPKNQTSYMDSAQNLQHGATYEYSLFAMDSLDQIVAVNKKEATCDTGSVFIPEIKPFLIPYFNGDSILVSWQWRNPDGSINYTSSRGAVRCLIQVSVSRTFPSIANQTEERMIGFSQVTYTAKVGKPKLASAANDTVYFRMTAWDQWNHPSEILWSIQFYPMKTAIYDPIRPLAVKDLSIDSIKADYKNSNAVITTLQWSGAGVETPDSIHQNVWSPLLGNVMGYRIIRTDLENYGSTVVDEIPINPTSMTYHHSSIASNKKYRWQVLGIDSAGNTTHQDSVRFVDSFYIATPEPPVPTQFRGCTIQPLLSDTEVFEYFVEIAMDTTHFRLAYEMDPANPEIINHLLCRSVGWIDGPEFTCETGWGTIELDTTWFRVKARVQYQDRIESGWSYLCYYAGENDVQKEKERLSMNKNVPEVFAVQQNYPNPFNATTHINYQIPYDGFVLIRIYNILGSLVSTLVEEEKPAGYYSVEWDAADCHGTSTASGIYLIQVTLETQKKQIYQKRFKMMYIK